MNNKWWIFDGWQVLFLVFIILSIGIGIQFWGSWKDRDDKSVRLIGISIFSACVVCFLVSATLLLLSIFGVIQLPK